MYLATIDYDIVSHSDPDSLFDNSTGLDLADDDGSESPLDKFDNEFDDDDPFDDEVWRPADYYIAVSVNLDVGRLGQKRYSAKTQDQLALVKEYHTKSGLIEQWATLLDSFANVALDPAPSFRKTLLNAFTKSRPTSSMGSWAGSAISDGGKLDDTVGSQA